jgi:hypothetical protein
MFRYLKNRFVQIDDFKCTVPQFLQLEPNADFGNIDEIYYAHDKQYQITNNNQTGYINPNIETYIANKQFYIDQLAIINTPTPPTLEEVKQQKITQIKAECQRRIYKDYPDYKQRNLIADGVELIALYPVKADRPPEVVTKLEEYQTYKKKVDALRDKSNKFENSLDNLSLDELQQLDITNDEHWN